MQGVDLKKKTDMHIKGLPISVLRDKELSWENLPLCKSYTAYPTL